jgi:hypothetical protein
MPSKHYTKDKFTWCLSTYANNLLKEGYQIQRIRPCIFGSDCYNCHSEKDFKYKPHIEKWNTKCKEHVDLYKIQQNILIVLSTEKHLVKNLKFKSKVQHIESMSFIDLLFFWQDITRYHRKIRKEFNYNKEPNYNNIKLIPKFFLNNEDDIWALVRTLRFCPQHKEIFENKSKVYKINEICPGMDNCKIGVHSYKDLVCIDDILEGNCSCENQEVISKRKSDIQKKIDTLQEQLSNNGKVGEDGFQINLSKQTIKKMRTEVLKLQHDLSAIRPRKVHYTEQKLVPLKHRIDENTLNKPKQIDVKNIGTKKVTKLKKKNK